MKAMLIVLAANFAVLDRPATAQSAAAVQQVAATSGSAAARDGPIKIDRNFMIGRWTDDGDCSDVIEFTRDGRFITDGGGVGGAWNLERDRLTMTGRATATIRIVPIDRDTITVINEEGALGRSTRC